MKRWLLLLCLIGVISLRLSAQNEIKLGLIHTLSTQNEQAFWLTRNDFGLLRDDQANFLQFAQIESSIFSSKQFQLSSGGMVSWNAARSSQVWLPMGWIKATAWGIELEAGRFDMSWENPADPLLSSGDLRFGRSSVPMPMIRIQTPHWFQPIPFFELFEMKLMMLHGWMEDSRSVRNGFVHAKSGQFSLNLDGFRPRFGLTHMAQWGGISQNGARLPSSFDNFLRIFSIQGGGNDAPEGEQLNVLGNHLGSWDMGFDWESEQFQASFVWHHIFDDGSGQRMRNGSDGMLRVVVKHKEATNERSFVSEFVYEYLNTTTTSGWGGSDGPSSGEAFDPFGFRYGGRETYYTHGIYGNGWTYLGQPLHSPLFMRTSEALRWVPEGQIVSANPNSFASVNNLAHHIAWKGYLPAWVPGNWSYRHQMTAIRYYGNVGSFIRYLAPNRASDNIVSSDYAFYPDIVQYYARLDLIKDWKWAERAVQTTFSFAMDRGEWHRTFGFGLAIVVSL